MLQPYLKPSNSCRELRSPAACRQLSERHTFPHLSLQSLLTTSTATGDDDDDEYYHYDYYYDGRRLPPPLPHCAGNLEQLFCGTVLAILVRRV